MKKEEFEAIPKNERIRYLSGTLFYPSVHVVNRSAEGLFKAPPMYVVTLALDKENQALAEAYGLKVKQLKDGEKVITSPYVEIKRKVHDEADIDKARPTVIDANQDVIPTSILIGNGSKGRVKFGTYWYDNVGGGVGSTLFTVQVTDLIPYTGGANGVDLNFEKSSDGFTVGDVSDIDSAPQPVENTLEDMFD